jgi:putative ABC transport system ATP-binding protein
VKQISYKEERMKKIVELKNVSKVYKAGEKEFKALDDIDLAINEGEFVVVLGPSGAGKSTLLNLIGGMDTPTSGQIIIDDENISNYNEEKLSEYRAENIGFIFQFYNILPTLTVLENVEIVKDIVKNAGDSKSALEAVGLIEHINKFPNQLSGGEQQRVSIARAIAKNPKLLLCDEPTGALDSKTGVEVLKLLKKQCDANNGNNTVIVVTHNSLFAEIADTVIRVKNGKIESVVSNENPKEIDEVNW